MRRGQIASDEEVAGAGREAFRGAAHGAATWGIAGLAAAGLGYFFSPVYRGLTIQFKVYLQMSCMTVGGCLEAERRVRDYEVVARRMRRVRREQLLWKEYTEAYDDRGETREAQSDATRIRSKDDGTAARTVNEHGRNRGSERD